MQQYAIYSSFYCTIPLHVSGVLHTHHQEYIKLYVVTVTVQAIWSCSCTGNER